MQRKDLKNERGIVSKLEPQKQPDVTWPIHWGRGEGVCHSRVTKSLVLHSRFKEENELEWNHQGGPIVMLWSRICWTNDFRQVFFQNLSVGLGWGVMTINYIDQIVQTHVHLFSAHIEISLSPWPKCAADDRLSYGNNIPIMEWPSLRAD